MIMNQTEMPLDSLVGELFGRASRRRSWVAVGWGLALASHAAAAQQPEEAVDFTTDPHGASYGGGVVAVGGTDRKSVV